MNNIKDFISNLSYGLISINNKKQTCAYLSPINNKRGVKDPDIKKIQKKVFQKSTTTAKENSILKKYIGVIFVAGVVGGLFRKVQLFNPVSKKIYNKSLSTVRSRIRRKNQEIFTEKINAKRALDVGLNKEKKAKLKIETRNKRFKKYITVMNSVLKPMWRILYGEQGLKKQRKVFFETKVSTLLQSSADKITSEHTEIISDLRRSLDSVVKKHKNFLQKINKLSKFIEKIDFNEENVTESLNQAFLAIAITALVSILINQLKDDSITDLKKLYEHTVVVISETIREVEKYHTDYVNKIEELIELNKFTEIEKKILSEDEKLILLLIKSGLVKRIDDLKFEKDRITNFLKSLEEAKERFVSKGKNVKTLSEMQQLSRQGFATLASGLLTVGTKFVLGPYLSVGLGISASIALNSYYDSNLVSKDKHLSEVRSILNNERINYSQYQRAIISNTKTKGFSDSAEKAFTELLEKKAKTIKPAIFIKYFGQTAIGEAVPMILQSRIAPEELARVIKEEIKISADWKKAWKDSFDSFADLSNLGTEKQLVRSHFVTEKVLKKLNLEKFDQFAIEKIKKEFLSRPDIESKA